MNTLNELHRLTLLLYILHADQYSTLVKDKVLMELAERVSALEVGSQYVADQV